MSTFSGGMKRRLSVALSLIGDPKVIFLGTSLWCLKQSLKFTNGSLSLFLSLFSFLWGGGGGGGS